MTDSSWRLESTDMSNDMAPLLLIKEKTVYDH